MIYVDDYGIEKDKVYIIQLLVIMGKFHIHKMKWSVKFKVSQKKMYFINEFKQYCNTVDKCKAKKALRTSNIICKFEIDK